jgi:ribosomal protein L37AE/L43A
MAIIRTEINGSWCENCKFQTAGIIENGIKVCPRCKRKLSKEKEKKDNPTEL